MSEAAAWAQVREIFHEALARPPHLRDLFLAEACHGDGHLESEIRSLLEAHAGDGLIALLDSESSTPPRLYGLENDCIGPWRILRPIGQGGMGMVFLATRKEHGIDEIKCLQRAGHDHDVVERADHAGVALELHGQELTQRTVALRAAGKPVARERPALARQNRIGCGDQPVERNLVGIVVAAGEIELWRASPFDARCRQPGRK